MMHRARLYFVSLSLMAALIAPISIIAAPKAQNASLQIRVYDKNHKDYHNWDDNENHLWLQFNTDNHRKQHDYQKSSKKEQAQYWSWRHDHEHDNDRH